MESRVGTIRIEALRVEAILGLLDHERRRRQAIVVGIEVDCDTAACARTDDLALALDYRELAGLATDLARAGRFRLLETYVERLADAILATGRVTRVEVRATKPGAIDGAAGATVAVGRQAATPPSARAGAPDR